MKPRSLSAHLRWLSPFTHRISFGLFSALLLAVSVGCAAGKAGSDSFTDPAITSFIATPQTIVKGTQTILSWSTNETTGLSFSISDGAGNLSNANSTPLSSTSLAVSPAVTTTYTMKATNQSGKTDTATVVVRVVDQPTINSFSASPATIPGGQSTTLSWSVSGVTNLSIDHGVGDVTGTTSVSVSPADTTVYTLTAKNGDGTTSAQVTSFITVAVVSRPVITNFAAFPSIISSGQHSTLRLAVTGETALSIDNGVGDITGRSHLDVSPTATTTYTLTASHTQGSVTATATAQATVNFSSAALPAISSFISDHPSVGPNGLATLTANFDLGQGGGTATITSDNGATTVAQGSSSPLVTTLPLPSSTTFTLTAKNVDGNSVTAQTRVLAGSVTSLAGLPNISGNVDGTGPAARFNQPNKMAVNAAGTLYVSSAQDNNFYTIRLVTTPGAVVATLIDSGTGLPVQLTGPSGIAVDLQGNLYLADTNNHTIDVIAPGGALTILAGTPGIAGSNDSPDAHFNTPSDLAVDNSGNIYVTDLTDLTIRKITAGGIVTTLAGTARVRGSNDSPNPHFSGFGGIAINPSTGNLYVTDSSSTGSTIRMITPAGEVTTLAGVPNQKGTADGTGSSARFNSANGIALDLSGNIYVTEPFVFTIRKVTPDGVVSTIIGVPTKPNGTNPGGALPSKITSAFGIAASPVPNGNLYFNLSNAIYTAPY